MSEEKNLKRKVASGILWKGMERISAQTISVVVSIILARILEPDDYSVVSIAAIFFAFCDLFISSGLNQALIQKKDADELDYSTIFTTNLICAFFLYIVMFFCAPAIAKLYHKPIVTNVIRVLGLTFFIDAYKAVLSAKVSSDMLFRKFFFSTIIGTILSAIVGVFMAVKGFGVWALVAQQMTNSLVDSLILSITVKKTFFIRFSKDRFKSLFDYGGKIFFASILSVIYDECRPLIVGIKFSPVDLAYYNKGMNFPMLINSIGNNTLSSALFPAMAKVQDDRGKILSITRRFMRISSFLVFPMMLGLLAISENFVRVLLTDKWISAVPFMMIFCISYMLDLIQVGNLQAIKALGRSDLILKMEIIKKSLYAVVIILFILFSDNPLMLAASGLVTSVIATIVNTYPNKGLIGYGYLSLIKDLLPNLMPSIIMCIIVLAMGKLDINAFVLLLLQILTGVLSYLGMCFLLKNENLIYLFQNAKELLTQKTGA